MNADIDTMEAGREMDAMVAERVMGLEVNVAFPTLYDTKMNTIHRYAEIPHYSTDNNAAWEVVEKLRGRGIAVTVSTLGTMNHQACAYTIWHEVSSATTWAESAPLAICKAALKAVQEQEHGS